MVRHIVRVDSIYSYRSLVTGGDLGYRALDIHSIGALGHVCGHIVGIRLPVGVERILRLREVGHIIGGGQMTCAAMKSSIGGIDATIRKPQ
jgi:hypothetical protein